MTADLAAAVGAVLAIPQGVRGSVAHGPVRERLVRALKSARSGAEHQPGVGSDADKANGGAGACVAARSGAEDDETTALLDAPARSGAEPGDDTAAPLAWWSPGTRCVYTDRPSWPASFAEDADDAVPLAPVPSSVPRAPVEALLDALHDVLLPDDVHYAVTEVRRYLDTTTNQPEEGRQ